MKLKWKIALPVLVLLLLSTLVTTLMNYFITRKSVDTIMDQIIESNLDTLVSQVERAAQTEIVLSGEMDMKNLALTRAFAEIVRLNAIDGNLNPQDESYFQKIAALMDVSEVHITDDKGVLIGGSIEGYYGFDFNGDAQAGEFIRILSDPSYELAQEPQPNGATGALFQYTGATRTDEKGIVQVGLDADVIQRLHKLLDVANTAKDMRIGATGRASIITDGVITYHNIADKIGQVCTAESWYKQVSSGRGKDWIKIDGETYYTGYANTGGMTLLVLFPQAEYNGYLTPALNSSIIGLLIALIITVLIYFLMSHSLKPLAFLSIFMNKAGATGDLTLRPEDVETIEKLSQAKDEIGQTISGCAGFVQHVTKIASELERVASGDLSVHINELSEADTMGKSLNNMVDKLDSMFLGINSSAQQVSAGSKQVAEGAQSLAQSSTQQAASVEELSASIGDIAQNIKKSAETAAKTSKLSEEIRVNAEKGSRQMGEMTEAVREINQASQSIGKIIKTIDDIAFQTNILALNAAVEAARAGQHGKGFAVVAEEVRNLASKSADAAKETGGMIENSMEKAELGSRIANETAASLAEIVTGINTSNQFINDIAKALEDESQDVLHINAGIDQVASAVQMNSATAEESAAASEEMSGQSAMLQDLIAQFRLKEQTESRSRPGLTGSGSRTALPAAADRPNGDFGKY